MKAKRQPEPVEALKDPALIEKLDAIIAQNRDLPGATMVVLNEVQKQVGYISKTHPGLHCQKAGCPGEHGPRCGFLLFLLHHHPARKAYGQVLPGHRLLRGRHTAVDRESQTDPRDRTRPDHSGWRDHPGTLPLRGCLQPGTGRGGG